MNYSEGAMEPKPDSRRLYSLTLIILSLICLGTFYQMAWVDTPSSATRVFGEAFGGGERNGWELLEWTQNIGAVARLPMWVIWFTEPLIALLACLYLALGNTAGRLRPWVRRSQVLAGVLSGALVAALTFVVLLIEDPELLQEGYWIAGFCAICLTEGFAILVREFDAIPGAPSVPTGNAVLIVHSGSAQGTRIAITVSPFTIGRQEQNLFVLPDDLTVSRQHAVILYHNGSYFLRAVSPAQPFWVGKTADSLRQELSWRLDSHDFFTIGESLIEFNIEPSP
jgi:hypothetical protein